MGCGKSKEGDVIQPRIIASKGNGSQPSIITEKFKFKFNSAVKTVTQNMKEAKYNTLTDYLTEATKCLLLLAQELKEYDQTEATHEQGQTCNPVTLQTKRFLLARQFRGHMSELGFFSANTKAFEPIFEVKTQVKTPVKTPVKTAKDIIEEVIDAILICIYLISILHDAIIDTELNNNFKKDSKYVNPVAHPTKVQQIINVHNNKFNLLKIHLLNEIENQYGKIYYDTSLKEKLKEALKPNIISVFNAMDNK